MPPKVSSVYEIDCATFGMSISEFSRRVRPTATFEMHGRWVPSKLRFVDTRVNRVIPRRDFPCWSFRVGVLTMPLFGAADVSIVARTGGFKKAMDEFAKGYAIARANLAEQ